METIDALPAYGRTYETGEACADDWDAGKDFKIFNGPYFSIRDIAKLKEDGYSVIYILTSTGFGPILTIHL